MGGLCPPTPATGSHLDVVPGLNHDLQGSEVVGVLQMLGSDLAIFQILFVRTVISLSLLKGSSVVMAEPVAATMR